MLIVGRRRWLARACACAAAHLHLGIRTGRPAGSQAKPIVRGAAALLPLALILLSVFRFPFPTAISLAKTDWEMRSSSQMLPRPHCQLLHSETRRTMMMPSPSPAPSSFDELTTEVVEAVKTMTPVQKANLLLNTSLAMIDAGQCVDIFFFFFSLVV